MLRIYQVILDSVQELQPVVRRIEIKDRDLGRQLRRASCSIALNVAEGWTRTSTKSSAPSSSSSPPNNAAREPLAAAPG